MATYTWNIIVESTKPFWLQLHISDNNKELNKHAKEINEIFNLFDDDIIDGQFIPFEINKTFEENDEEYKNCFGMLFLAKDTIQFGTIIHESLHAAKIYDRQINNSNNNYTAIADEERLAYLITKISGTIIDTLIDCKYLKRVKQLYDYSTIINK